jgi:ligand-binding sensor domain-containing protein/DNA-binding CsgD family transcriptional regulator
MLFYLKKRLLASIFLFFLGIYINIGQVKNIGIPAINNFKRIDYKGGTQNWNIDQDKFGNMYFANNEGLLQFDGSSWTKFNLPNSTSIRCLKIDPSGKIFVGGYNDFGYFQANKKGKLNYVSIAKMVNANELKETDFIWKIHLFENEVIFQSFSKIFIFNGKSVKIIKAPFKFQFSFLVNEKLYFQDDKLGMLSYSKGKFNELKNTKLLNGTEVWGIIPLGPDKMLFVTIDKGLFIYQNETLTIWQTEANTFIKKNNALGAVLIKDKFIVLNSVLDGTIICDQSGTIVQHLNRKKGLQNNTVLTSFVDSKNNLWLGLDNGITFVNENSPFTFFGVSYGISTVYASIVCNNNLYVATNQGVFYHAWNYPFKEENFKLVEGTTGQAWNIQAIDNQIFCAHNRGAFLINNGKLIQNFDSKGYWGFKIFSNNSKLLLGCNYKGFSIFEKTPNGWVFKNQLLGFEKSSNLFEVDDHYIWLKKDDLIYRFRISTDFKTIIEQKTFNKFTTNEIGIGNIQKIDGELFFQNKNNFYSYSFVTQKFQKNIEFSKLFQKISNLKTVDQDSNGNIWYIANSYLGVFMKKQGNYQKVLSPFSNLSKNLVENYLSINFIDNRNIFIGLTDGIAHYDANFLDDFSEKPKAFIKSFSTSKDTIFSGNLFSKTRDLKIPYSLNNVKFTFSSPTYDNLENVNYAYQLENFDQKWSSWSNFIIKEYTNLREGNYTMKVKVKNSYGVESAVSGFNFTVSPPFYRHFLAYVFYLLVFGSVIYLVRIRIKWKIRKNKYYETIEQRRLYLEKEAKIRQEQFDLEKEIEKLKNDTLQIKILAKDKELVNNSLQVVKKNKILNGIIHNIKDIDVSTLNDTTKFQFNKLNKSIVKEVNSDKSWKDLEKHIKNVHFDFLKRLKEKYPTISPRELDLSTYLLINMSTKEIAEIMNISSGGVELARYRLRKKLDLTKKENLTGFLMGI